MNLTLNGGTAQQRSWFNRALSHCRYNFDVIDADVQVSWPPEPSCPGHKEFACTHWDAGVGAWMIEIRNTLDHDQTPLFYDETCVHELGHVAWFVRTTDAQRQAMCPWFYRPGTSGDGNITGTAADLSDPAEWDLRIIETMAEMFKDATLPDSSREFDNRTQWRVDEPHWADVMGPLFPASASGTEKTVTWAEGIGS